MLTYDQAVLTVAAYMIASNKLTGTMQAPALVPIKKGQVEIKGTILDRDGKPHELKEVYVDDATALRLAIAMDTIKQAVKIKL